MDFLPSPIFFAGGPSLGGLSRKLRSDSWSLTPNATLFATDSKTSSRSLAKGSSKRRLSAPRIESSIFSTVKTADVAATLLQLNASYHNWSKQLTCRKKGVALTSSATTPLVKVLSLNLAYVDKASRVQRQVGPALLCSRASFTRTAQPVASATQEVTLAGNEPQVLQILQHLNAAYTRSTSSIHSSPSCKLLGSRLSQLRALNQAYTKYTQQELPADDVPLRRIQKRQPGVFVPLAVCSSLQQLNLSYVKTVASCADKTVLLQGGTISSLRAAPDAQRDLP